MRLFQSFDNGHERAGLGIGGHSFPGHPGGGVFSPLNGDLAGGTNP